MKIKNLIEKDTVLDDDYLIVDGTDGTKKAKKSAFLKEVNGRFHQIKKQQEISGDVSFKYTGISIVIPAKSFFSITARATWGNKRPSQVGIATSSSDKNSQIVEGTATTSVAACTYSDYTENEITLYIWGKWTEASLNLVDVCGFYADAL